MQIACLVYDGFTATDIVGPFEVVSRIPGAETVFVARESRVHRNDNQALGLVADRTLDEVEKPDLVLVPGGMEGTRAAARDESILSWIRSTHEHAQCTASVCTGSLILGAAGLLEGLEATTHWAAREELERTGATYVARRWVDHGHIVTAAGVSAGIDMALALVARLLGEELAQAIQLGLEYDPQPPFDCGSVEKASPEIVAALSKMRL